MNIPTITLKLDNKYGNREIVQTIQGETLSYPNKTNTNITINTTTYKPHRICLTHKQNTVYLYIHTINKKHHKMPINTINTIT